MSPNPTLKVLSTFLIHDVRALLIGGQACILYGAAEFSRDSDFVVLVTTENLRHLRQALNDLQAEPIFFPPLLARHLRRGHACQFRCHAGGVQGFRVDVMARLRGCDSFGLLWRRRSEVQLSEDQSLPVIGLRDLVRSKKTQRDKDWLMLRRLVENDIGLHRADPAPGQVSWWLRECRTPETLLRLADAYPRDSRAETARRPLLRHALDRDAPALATALHAEELEQRELDRQYWQPLRQELEAMRRGRTARDD